MISRTTQKLPLYVKKLNDKAMIPVKGSERAAGYDIFSPDDYVVPAKGKVLVKTGLSLAIPSGNYGRVGNSRQPILCSLSFDY